MTPDRWKRITEVFEATLDEKPEHRLDFLRSACAGDPALYEEVESLLKVEDKAGPWLDGLADDLLNP